MKKFTAIILSTIIFLLSMGIQTFAINISEEEDILRYTLDDIANMSASEFRQLLTDFERIYDPFGTYESDPIMDNNDTGVSPLWSSGKEDGSETGSHEIITARACVVLSNDIGFFGNNSTEQLVASLAISLASLLPDEDEIGVLVFAGHFYDPTTEENWAGQTDNTAKTNAHAHFVNAVHAYENNDKAGAYEQLGRALHYLQDACQPMHASNYKNIPIFNETHHDFEAFVDTRVETYVNRVVSVNNYTFQGKGNYPYRTFTPSYYVKEAAKIAYSYKNYTNTSNQANWDYAANVTVQNAVAFSSLLMYSFSGFADITLK